MPQPDALVDAPGLFHELWLVLDEGENSHLDRRHARVELEESSLLAANLSREDGGSGKGRHGGAGGCLLYTSPSPRD